MTTPEIDLQHLLNAQTGKVGWPELARHFARGVVICVNSDQDLVEIAGKLVLDQADKIDGLLQQGLLHRALDNEAIRWQEEHTELWAVVVAPWVLVQDRSK